MGSACGAWVRDVGFWVLAWVFGVGMDRMRLREHLEFALASVEGMEKTVGLVDVG